MKRKPLSKKEIKELNEKIIEFNFQIDKKENIEIVENKYYCINKEVAFFIYNNQIIPSLKFLLKNEINLPTAIVDMGAIKFIVNGADIMIAGIKEFIGEIKQNNFVIVKDEVNKKPLVIGIALDTKENLLTQEKGKALKNIHYIGDDIWNFKL